MRLNDYEVRKHVIEAMEACVPNKRHLPWKEDRLPIHRYLYTIAEMNNLDYLDVRYQGYELEEWNVYKPLAEKAIIPSRVVAVVDEYAVDLINRSQYQMLNDDVYITENIRLNRNNEGQQVKAIVKETHRYEAMTLPEFNQMTLALIQVMRGNVTNDMVTLKSYRKEALQSEVADREIVNNKVKSMHTIGLHLTTTSFMPICYAYDADVAEQMAFQIYMAKYVKGEATNK